MKPIPALEREWVEGLLAAMALAPDTRDDYTNQPVGMICGVARPEYGPAIYDLRCQICEATWSGIPGDPCWWCEDALDRQRDHQATLLLTPPDVDPDDARYEGRLDAWAERMDVGVEARLISRAQADTAWKRTLKRMAS
jgi:hypothetical protein